MKKKDLIQAFVASLEEDLKVLKEAAMNTYEAATNEESQPENEYDTRALEASYLAGAQAKRVQEIEELMGLFHSLVFREFGPEDGIANTALVDLELDGKKNRVLMMPKGGGVSLRAAGQAIQIVTPTSALGETLVGLRVGETADFEVGEKIRECTVLAVN